MKPEAQLIIDKARAAIQENQVKNIILMQERGERSLKAVIEANNDDLRMLCQPHGNAYSLELSAYKFLDYMRDNPHLYQCSALSIFKTFKQSVINGLVVDETAGEIWIDTYIDDTTKEETMCGMVGTKGLQTMCLRHCDMINHFTTHIDPDYGFIASIYWKESHIETDTFKVSFEEYQYFVGNLKRGKYFHEKYPHRMGQYLAMRELIRSKHFNWKISSEIIKQEKIEQGL